MNLSANLERYKLGQIGENKSAMQTDLETAIGIIEKMRDALEQYTQVVSSINDPNDFTPKMKDEGKPARDLLAELKSHGFGKESENGL